MVHVTQVDAAHSLFYSLRRLLQHPREEMAGSIRPDTPAISYNTMTEMKLKMSRFQEFNPPNSSVLTAWLVIASGVVISMVMLAVVLWRFSCFEDYTRFVQQDIYQRCIFSSF